MCDVTRPASLDAAKLWKAELDERLGDAAIPVILVANKSDLLQGGTKSFATGARVAHLAQECGFRGWFVASAKRDANITLGVEFLMNEILTQQATTQATEAARTATSQSRWGAHGGLPGVDHIDLSLYPLGANSAVGCC